MLCCAALCRAVSCALRCVVLCLMRYSYNWIILKYKTESKPVHPFQAEVSKLPFRWQVRDENMACGLCYTSGTTGNPKVCYCFRRPSLPVCFLVPLGMHRFLSFTLFCILHSCTCCLISDIHTHGDLCMHGHHRHLSSFEVSRCRMALNT